MTNTAFDHQHLFTYGDYLKWPEDERWELIEGIAYNMTPGPSETHQDISAELTMQIRLALKGNPCRMYAAPYDVRLPDHNEADEDISTVVQPDIVVICDSSKRDNRGCRGAPDFIIEIISPSTARKDQINKTILYEKHGVREYWIMHPQDQLLHIRTLNENGVYNDVRIMGFEETMAVKAVPGLEIDLDAIAELCEETADLKDDKDRGKEVRI